MKRIFLLGAAAVTIACVAASVILWTLLASWVPTKGKTFIIQAVEQQAPVSLSIGTMRYDLLRGFLLEQVHLIDRRTHEPLASASTIHVRIRWLTLLLQRQVSFAAQAALEAPGHTDLALLGQYQPRTKSVTLDARTGDLPVRSIQSPLTRYVPPSLTDGTLRLTFHAVQRPESPLTLSGRLSGTHLVWSPTDMTWTGDLTLNGSATLPRRSDEALAFQALLAWRHGTIEGLPTIHTITNIEGTAQLSQDGLQIEHLAGDIFGTRWNAEGTVAPIAHPAVEVLLSSRVDIAPWSAAVNPLNAEWQPSGRSDLRMVCRGPLEPTPRLDCLLHANLQDATLAGSKLKDPITKMTGSLAYDALAQQLSIEQLQAHLLDETLSTRGTIAFLPHVNLALDLQGTLPLAALTNWLPAQGPVNQLGGRATLQVHLEGPPTRLRSQGDVELHDVTMRLSTAAHTVDRLSGHLHLHPEEITTDTLSLQLDGQPVTLTATLTPSAVPTLVATARAAEGRLSLTSRFAPDDVLIEDAQLTLGHSRVQLSGTYGRLPHRPSALTLTGTIELADVTHIPFVALRALEPWQLNGVVTVEVKMVGDAADWPATTLRGRVRSDHVSIRDVPVDQLLCEVTQDNHMLHLRIPAALLAEGKLFGDLTIEHHPTTRDFRLQADLMGLQLARLTQVIPAWRSRDVSGIASAHASLAGTWETRASWQGDGWLNASGQGLGDVPLLDRVFHGLFGMLGDRMGLDSLRRAQITDASVQWRLLDERFRTENLRVGGMSGTEPVAIYAKGSVGLDQTLDFIIEPELSEGVLLQAPTTASIATTILKAAGQLERLRRLIGRHRLTGTLAKPEYRFELNPQDVFKQLAPAPADLLHNLLDAVRQ